jgi:hypothetical protein
VRAPSIHNTQPWLFTQLPDGSMELSADTDRTLPATDPHGRELVISCGAALATLTLGMRWLGNQPLVHLLPDPANSNLLARVCWGPAYRPNNLDLDMFAGVLDRHTHRGPFEDRPVPTPLLVQLRRLARHAHCRADVIHGVRSIGTVTRLTRLAQRAQRKQDKVRAELTQWLRPPGDTRRDGIHTTTSVSADHYGLGRLAPRLPARAKGAAIDAGGVAWPPVTMLLTTDRDDPHAWLHAGEALQRILVYAACHGISASLHTQPLELPAIRAEVAALVAGTHPQMLMQLGYTNSVSQSPRRPPTEVLTVI